MNFDKQKNSPFWFASIIAIGSVGFFSIPKQNENSNIATKVPYSEKSELADVRANDLVNQNTDDALLPLQRFLQFQKDNIKTISATETTIKVDVKKGAINIDTLKTSEKEDSLNSPNKKEKLDAVIKEFGKNIDFEFIITTVPDPFGTNFKTEFDWAIEGIQKAYGAKKFTLKAFKLPEDTEKKQNLQDNKLYKKFKDNPGVLIFAEPGIIDEKNIFKKKVAIVFLVWESPTFGINKYSLAKSILAGANLNAIINNKYSPTNILRIIGPYFSGSQTGLAEAIVNIKKNNGDVNLKQYLDNLILTNCSALKVNYDFLKKCGINNIQTTVHDNDTVICAVINYMSNNKTQLLKSYKQLLNEKGKIGNVAFLRELNTGFGNRFNNKNDKMREGFTDLSKNVLEIPYPLSISKVDLIDKNWLKKNQELPHAEMAEKRLPGQNIAFNDTFPYFDEDALISSSGNWLRNLNITLKNNSIEVIGIFGTDKRDVVYLNKFVKRNTNGIQVFCTNPNLAILQPDDSEHLRGMIVGSTYPLFPEAQNWFIKDKIGNGEFQKYFTFPSQNSNSFFNAILANSPNKDDKKEMHNYWSKRKFLGIGEIKNPPIWISIVGSGGKLIPVHCYTDISNINDNDQYMIKVSVVDNNECSRQISNKVHFSMAGEIVIIFIVQLLFCVWLVNQIVNRDSKSYTWIALCSLGMSICNVYLTKPALFLISELGPIPVFFEIIYQVKRICQGEECQIDSAITTITSFLLLSLNLFCVIVYQILNVRQSKISIENKTNSHKKIFWFLQIGLMVFLVNIQFNDRSIFFLTMISTVFSVIYTLMFVDFTNVKTSTYVCFLPIGISFLWVVYCLLNLPYFNIQSPEWFFLSLRLSDNGSGASPFIPMLFIGGAFWVLGFYWFKIECYKKDLEMDVEKNDDFSMQNEKLHKLATDFIFNRDKQENKIIDFLKTIDIKKIIVIIVGFVISVRFLFFTSVSIDGQLFEILITFMNIACTGIIGYMIIKGLFIFENIQNSANVVSKIYAINGYGIIPESIIKIFYGNIYSKRPSPYDLDDLILTLPDDIKTFVFGKNQDDNVLEKEYPNAFPFIKKLKFLISKDLGIIYGRWTGPSEIQAEFKVAINSLIKQFLLDYTEKVGSPEFYEIHKENEKKTQQEIFFGFLNEANKNLSGDEAPKAQKKSLEKICIFLCSYLVLKFGYSIALLRQFALSILFSSFLMLLAVSSYPFRFFDVWMMSLEIILAGSAIFIGYVIIQINKNRLFSKILNTEPGQITFDSNLISSFGTFVFPIVGILILNVLGIFRFVLDPILFYLF